MRKSNKNAAPPELKGRNNILLQECRSSGAYKTTILFELYVAVKPQRGEILVAMECILCKAPEERHSCR